MGADKRRRRRRGSRRGAGWHRVALALVLGAAAGFLVRQRSLSLPPLAPPRWIARQPGRAPAHAQLQPRAPAQVGGGAPQDADAASNGGAADADAANGLPPATADAPPVEARARFDEPAAPERLAALPKAAPAAVDSRPRVAIVIDDLGDSLEAARAVLDLEPAVTLAVIPFRRYSTRVAAAAVERGREVILHLPLEPAARRRSRRRAVHRRRERPHGVALHAGSRRDGATPRRAPRARPLLPRQLHDSGLSRAGDGGATRRAVRAARALPRPRPAARGGRARARRARCARARASQRDRDRAPAPDDARRAGALAGARRGGGHARRARVRARALTVVTAHRRC
ncbi:MAG: hypothetical protein E6J72_02115 [Deltaproteobacteria bacterium]|nr:MAG: hypothetical protein E6J72_02115 [Deltaproteobacteria bacterium]